jgi:UDP-glucose 4-epimerase
VNILVTGGAGYIGSHAAVVLKRHGFCPVIFDNFSTGHRWAVQAMKVVEADLGDRAAIDRALEEHNIHSVLHFAASAYVHESVADPRKYFQNNVINTLNLLNSMLDHDIKRLVYSSTCSTYGVPEVLPIPEQHPQHPVNPYGETKFFVERVLHWYERAYDLRWVSLRYFNAAGASETIGECRDPEVRVVPLAIKAALAGSVFTVFGTDYPTKDGSAVRDYVHVEDLASAHYLALEYLLKGSSSRAFNLGTGIGYSVRDVLAMVEQISGRVVKYRYEERRPGDPSALIADSQAAKEILNWEPVRSSLEQIVESAWKWFSALTQQKAVAAPAQQED